MVGRKDYGKVSSANLRRRLDFPTEELPIMMILKT
jgi:hypothetical protein